MKNVQYQIDKKSQRELILKMESRVNTLKYV
jgi:hypothetical protein